MTIEEWNKMYIWFNILIVLTKYSKFGSETTTIWPFLSCCVSVNSSLFYLDYNKFALMCIFIKNLVFGREASTPISRVWHIWSYLTVRHVASNKRHSLLWRYHTCSRVILIGKWRYRTCSCVILIGMVILNEGDTPRKVIEFTDW